MFFMKKNPQTYIFFFILGSFNSQKLRVNDHFIM